MKIELGEYELVHSGVVIEIKDYPIKIKIPDPVEGDFTFLINFKDDIEKKEPLTNLVPIDNFTLQLDFVNFHNFQGGGNTNLINVGTLEHKPLFINYRVFELKEVGKTLIFNFYTKNSLTNADK